MLAVFRFFLYNILIRFSQKQSNALHNDMEAVSFLGMKYISVRIQILNVNDGHNKQLMEACPTLHQYAILVSRIKTYSKKMDFEDAVNRAINECIEEDVLREFLLRRRAEVMNSILTEYDEEQVLAEGGKSEEEILGKLIKRFSLEYEDAKKYYDVCVKNTRK